jgi:hypothetical protein
VAAVKTITAVIERPQSAPISVRASRRYRSEAVRGEPGWRLTRIEVARDWSTQPLPAGARVAEINRGASAVASWTGAFRELVLMSSR